MNPQQLIDTAIMATRISTPQHGLCTETNPNEQLKSLEDVCKTIKEQIIDLLIDRKSVKSFKTVEIFIDDKSTTTFDRVLLRLLLDIDDLLAQWKGKHP